MTGAPRSPWYFSDSMHSCRATSLSGPPSCLGFWACCRYWEVWVGWLISKVGRPVGRRQTSKEVRELIFRMVVENPTWGAPRIHGELLMLGFDVSERTISRWMKR